MEKFLCSLMLVVSGLGNGVCLDPSPYVSLMCDQLCNRNDTDDIIDCVPFEQLCSGQYGELQSCQMCNKAKRNGIGHSSHGRCSPKLTSVVQKETLKQVYDAISTDDINCLFAFRKTRLMLLAQGGNAKVVDFLLCLGANVSLVDKHDNSALHHACFGDNVHIVQKLLQAGLPLESKTLKGRTCLLLAARNGHISVFDYLLSLNANVLAVTNAKRGLLHQAVFSDSSLMIEHIVRLNITGVSIEARDYQKMTPLHYAAFRNRTEAVKTLLSLGSSLDARDQLHSTVFHVAARYGSLEMVQFIVNCGLTNVTEENRNRWTPLSLAKNNRDKRVLDFLTNITVGVHL